jgi:hypothetical protein
MTDTEILIDGCEISVRLGGCDLKVTALPLGASINWLKSATKAVATAQDAIMEQREDAEKCIALVHTDVLEIAAQLHRHSPKIMTKKVVESASVIELCIAFRKVCSLENPFSAKSKIWMPIEF